MRLSGVLQRIEAWKRGAPVPIGETLPFPRSPAADRLIVAFVRMAGESLPWGFAAGRPGEAPVIRTAPEPRDAGEMATLARELAAVLLPHLPHPAHAPPEEQAEIAAVAGRRQLWLPGSSHVEVLHFLDFRYTLAHGREQEGARELAALGRAAGWLFRESTRPGQVRVFDATKRLRDAFAIPAEDVRQQHLGFVLAWLGAGTRDERAAAARSAEAQTVGVTMDPELERKELAPLVARWNEFRGNAEETRPVAAALHAVLAPELERRFRLAERALALFDDGPRPPNPELSAVTALAGEEMTYQYWNQELKASAPVTDPDAPRFLGNHPETDFLPTAAAARFFAHQHAAELTVAELVHGDRSLIEEAIDAGSALRGAITRVADEGTGRAAKPVWTVVAPGDGPLRLREESGVCVVGLRGRTGKIRSIVAAAGLRTVIVEIDGWKRARPAEGAPAATATALEGTTVTLIEASAAGISRMKSMKVWDGSGPGAWLTHAAPPPEPAPVRAIDGDLVELVDGLGGS